MLDSKTIEFIISHREEDPRTLALQARRYPDVDMRKAVEQIEGWQHAKEKLPTWATTDGIIYPPRISMEQCSSEATALYKANLVKGVSIADLTGGFGIDCSYMARRFKKAYYIERSELLCDIARWNFQQLKLEHIDIINHNSEEILTTLPKLDWIFIDPARRDSDGRKVVALSDCEPNIVELEEELLQKATKVMIKCSPMLDITAATKQLGNVEEIHVIAVNNECKELLMILGNGATDDIPITCVNMHREEHETFSFTATEEATAVAAYSNTIGHYLYEPNAAMQKSGCYRTLSQRLNINKLHPNSHLYTSDALVDAFPGRRFIVEKSMGFSKRDIKEIQSLGKANITVRNFPETAQNLRKKLKLADGGNTYLFATTVANGDKILAVCRKI